MNKLSYGLLSLLSTKPMSGYKLTSIINTYWRSTHSAIYPLLSQLELNGYISSTLKEQSDKPNKKIYTLTHKGIGALNDWLLSDSSPAVNRDEMILKLFCIKGLDNIMAEKLFDQFEKNCHKRLDEYKRLIQTIKQKCSDGDDVTSETTFGTFIIIQRSLSHVMLDLEWCEWARKVYTSKDFDFLDTSFIWGGRN